MPFESPRDQALTFIATYEIPEPGRYEKHLVKIARAWLRILDAPHTMPGMIAKVQEELSQPPPSDYGCGWTEMKRKFDAWADAQEQLSDE